MKIFAILNVIAWMGFWAFGYIALTSPELTTNQLTTATLLAAVGFAIGMYSYLRLSNQTKPFTPVQKVEG